MPPVQGSQLLVSGSVGEYCEKPAQIPGGGQVLGVPTLGLLRRTSPHCSLPLGLCPILAHIMASPAHCSLHKSPKPHTPGLTGVQRWFLCLG